VCWSVLPTRSWIWVTATVLSRAVQVVALAEALHLVVSMHDRHMHDSVIEGCCSPRRHTAGRFMSLCMQASRTAAMQSRMSTRGTCGWKAWLLH
jgi:hypothetical protein